MANSTRMPRASTAPTLSPATPAAIHRPITWLYPSLEHDTRALLVNRTRDVCYGVTLVLQLVSSMRDIAAGTTPILSVNDAERMMLLATTSARMLDDHLRWLPGAVSQFVASWAAPDGAA